jgi:hypothetical protein
MDFVLLNYKIIKLQPFRKGILLSKSGKKGGRGQKIYLFGPLAELASDLVQVAQQIGFLSSSPVFT